ncbi:MAG: Hsp33 family molecular chaperone HslO [Wenzhouxiangellaceae bacterium]
MSDARYHRFMFTEFAVRGAIVRLDDAWRNILSRHWYPDQVAQWLGEALATCVLIHSAIKRPGILSLQLRGPGPLRLLLAQATHDGDIRGLARFEEGVEQLVSLESMADQTLLSLQLQGESGEPYQGIVPLQGIGIGEAVESYFEQSEQLPTRLWLSVSDQQACGLLLQQLPRGDFEELDEDGWNRVVKLAQTITRRELLQLPPEQMLHRLFHQETLQLGEAQPLQFACSCSRQRVAQMLRSLGEMEVNQVVAERGEVEVFCEHCNERYVFDAVDATSIFHAGDNPPPASPTNQ